MNNDSGKKVDRHSKIFEKMNPSMIVSDKKERKKKRKEERMLNEIIVHEKDILNNKRNNEKIRPFSSILSQQGTLNLLLKKSFFNLKDTCC